jgi:HAMP domain.
MELLKQQNIVSIIREEKEIKKLLENQKINQILKKNHHEKLKNETNKFNTLSAKINIHINDEIQFIEKNLKHDVLLPSKIKLNKILKLLKKIAKEHHAFHEYAHAFIVSDMKNLNEINKKSQQLEQIDNELIRHIDNIFKEIEAFTQQSALTANEHEKDGIYITTIINIMTGIIGIIIGTIIAKKIIQPLFHILTQVKKIESGNFNAKTNIKTNDELTILGKSFNNMVKELNEKETIKNIFGQYIKARIVKRLIKTKPS